MSEFDEHLKTIYTEFASFGANRVTSQYSVFLDGPRFAKFAKDSKLLDKTNLTATDVDLIFAKSKAKTERRINFDQFRVALSMMAEKKYPNLSGDEAFAALAKKVISAQGPTANATQTATGGIYDKLTDSSLYTGSHKERFNADGTGKGIEGRDSISKGKGSHSLKTTASFDSGDHPDEAQAEGDDDLSEEVSRLDVSAAPSKAVKSPAKTTLSYSPPAKASPSGSSPARKPAATTRSPTSTTSKSPASKTSPSARGVSPTKKASIFDKLTDSSQYTGSHKNRFNSDGSGRGLAGRDSVAKAGVSGRDLSQMVKRK